MPHPLALILAAAGVLHACLSLQAQTEPTQIAPGICRLEGSDPENHVAYIRVFLTGTLTSPASSLPNPPPTLTAQCTRQPTGKLAFELFANFGGIGDFAYHRPWLPSDGGLFPPATEKATVTMEFLGYTRVKPVKRQWELVERPHGQLRYNSPSLGSANMEDIAYYFQYLKALPTLRLTWLDHSASFVTSPRLDQLRKEPLCRASGI